MCNFFVFSLSLSSLSPLLLSLRRRCSRKKCRLTLAHKIDSSSATTFSLHSFCDGKCSAPKKRENKFKIQIISTSFIMHSAITQLCRFEPDWFDPKQWNRFSRAIRRRKFIELIYRFPPFLFPWIRISISRWHLHITRMPKFSSNSRNVREIPNYLVDGCMCALGLTA